jgi:antagonist of KipI
MLEVVEPGLYSSIQDLGRAGFGHLGVRRAGAADELALAAANLLVGAAAEAPALEMTLLGGTFAVRADMLIGIAGADMEACVVEEGRVMAVGRSHLLRAGTTLAFGGALDGARTYLALGGGIACAEALGSCATDPIAGFGGIDGRPLRGGDLLAARDPSATDERAWPDARLASGIARAAGPRLVRVVDGPHRDVLPASVATSLVERTWTLTPRCDRVGLRLAGAPITGADMPDLISLPMLPGAIQVPPNGEPIVLMPDAPTVGGYPVPAVVIEADRHITGQLRPGDEVRFEWVDPDEARRLAHERFEALHQAAVALR